MIGAIPGMSATASMRLGAGSISQFGQGFGAPANAYAADGAPAAGGPTTSRLHPAHPGWWPAVFAALGLAAFGYATERKVSVRASGKAGPLEAEAGASA